MVGSGAAASSAHLYAHPCDHGHMLYKFLGTYVEHCLPVCHLGKSCIGIYHHWNAGTLYQPFYNGHHHIRAHAAVYTHSIRPKPLQHGNGCLNSTPCEKSAVVVVHTGNYNRESAVLLCRKKRRLCLITVAHGLNEHKVGSFRCPCPYYLGKYLHSPVKAQIPHRLQKFPSGAYIKSHIGIIVSACRMACPFCDIHPCCDYLIRLVTEFKDICTECVGVYYIRTGFIIAAVHFLDDVGAGQVPCLRQLPSCKAVLLQICPRPSVAEEPFFPQSLCQLLHIIILFVQCCLLYAPPMGHTLLYFIPEGAVLIQIALRAAARRALLRPSVQPHKGGDRL